MSEEHVVRLTGSESVTRGIATGAGIKDGKTLDDMVEVSEGNPGAMRYLLELVSAAGPCDGIAIPCLLACLKTQGITGTKFYSYVKARGGAKKDHQEFVSDGWM